MTWLGGQPQQSACRVRLDRELRRWADAEPDGQDYSRGAPVGAQPRVRRGWSRRREELLILAGFNAGRVR
jgi:hypothetical protein